MTGWYKDYLIHRNLHFEIEGAKICVSIALGFPQGGVASAKFWLLAFDGAVQIINSCNIKGTAFADDCVTLYGGSNIEHMIRHSQIVLNRLVGWGKGCGLAFNSNKTVVILFTRRRIKPPFQLEMDGREIPFQTSKKYLGAVSYTHLPSPRDRQKSRMPSSA